MEPKISQEQKLGWKMTPSLSQSIQLLQYNGMELMEYINEIMNENPLIADVEPVFDYTMPQLNRAITDGGMDFAQSPSLSMYEQLKQQVRETDVNNEWKTLIYYGIDSLNEEGYLTLDVQEWAESCSVKADQAAAGLKHLQSLEPAGIGARNLQECLLLQLERNYSGEKKVKHLVQKHLDWVAEQDLTAISEEYQITKGEARALIEMIQQCQPKPGLLLSKKQAAYIIPDADIFNDGSTWRIRINKWNNPTIHVAKEYVDFKPEDKETAVFIQKKSKQVEWLKQAINYRKLTMENVLKLIIQEQKAFFDAGPFMLKPLKLKDLAAQLEVHTSTVSRMLKNKHVQTPHGILPLNFFLQTAITRSNGEESSVYTVKQWIQELIEGENKSKPYSDEAISNLLFDQYGTTIARRTVAKYREQLRMPSSRKRKVKTGGNES